jgi:hypothetical protein
VTIDSYCRFELAQILILTTNLTSSITRVRTSQFNGGLPSRNHYSSTLDVRCDETLRCLQFCRSPRTFNVELITSTASVAGRIKLKFSFASQGAFYITQAAVFEIFHRQWQIRIILRLLLFLLSPRIMLPGQQNALPLASSLLHLNTAPTIPISSRCVGSVFLIYYFASIFIMFAWQGQRFDQG